MSSKTLVGLVFLAILVISLQATAEARLRRHRIATRCAPVCATITYSTAPQSRNDIRALRSSPADLARLILQESRISLATTHESGVTDQATARLNIQQTSRGEQAVRSSYGGAPGGTVQLQSSMLAGLLALAQTHGYTMSVSEVAGGSHSANSRHYVGVAFDINSINGSPVSSSHPQLQQFMQHCRDLGATEVLGPGTAGHATHVHAAWPRP